MSSKKNNNNGNKNLPENEWVIRLVDAAQEAVTDYEQYLLDRIGYNELAESMTELRDLLPDGFKDKKRTKKSP